MLQDIKCGCPKCGSACCVILLGYFYPVAQ